MNYYKRHIGDYAKKAGHLSVLEHGVYTLLLDAYYDREQAPTRAEALRQARARTPEEIAAVDAVLSDFFTLEGDRYTQRRVEEEFVKAEQVAKANASKGKLGGRPRKPKGKPEESRQLSDVKPDESPEKPNPPIHQSTTKQEQERSPKGSRLAADWQPSDADLDYAASQCPGVNVRIEAEKFRNYWQSKAGKDARKTDWHKTWCNWLLNSATARAGPNGRPAEPSRQAHGVASILGVSAHDLIADFTRGTVVPDPDQPMLGELVPAEPRRLSSG